ncbi:XRE family transcriptional regulator [Ligilactobacillus ruminis]|uniref:XRE family transcriptional regulator n=1 Tax=Ligilactobacillus ruminis TaxID=1623 RepID=UPI0034A54673
MGRNRLTPQEIELKKVISSNLNKLLEKTTKKKIDVHRLLNIPQSTVSDYFSGKTLPSEENISKLADFFGVNTYDIDPRMRATDYNYNELQMTLLTKYEKLNLDRKKKVVDYAEVQLKEQMRQQNKVHSINDTKNVYYVDVLGAVSAGTGEWLTREQHEEVSVNNEPPEYDFAVRVNGDSMTPLFSDGQIIYVNRVFETSEVRSNQFVIAELNGNAYVKKIVFSDNRRSCRLISLNKNYDDIVITVDDDFEVVGVVVI